MSKKKKNAEKNLSQLKDQLQQLNQNQNQQQEHNVGWILIKFELIISNEEEKKVYQDWVQSNFEVFMRAEDPLYLVMKLLNDKFGKIREVRLYEDFLRSKRIPYEFETQLGQIFKTKGESTQKKAEEKQKIKTVYFEFLNDIESPILLYDNPWMLNNVEFKKQDTKIISKNIP